MIHKKISPCDAGKFGTKTPARFIRTLEVNGSFEAAGTTFGLLLIPL